MKLFTATKLFGICLFFALAIASGTHAQDPAGKALGEAPNTGKSQPNSDWPTLVVPEDGRVESLATFIAETKKLRPSKPEQYLEMQRSIRTAAKRILEQKVDKTSAISRQAEADFVNASVMLLGNEGADAQVNTFRRFRDFLKEKMKLDFSDVQMAFLAGQNLEQFADPKFAKEAYEEFASILRSKEDPMLAEVIAVLEGNARRLDLLGKPFELTSKLISGEDFDLQSMKGKLVLIFFWASNSPPCEQEIPMMSAVYQKYKDQGFEIVGVGLDEKRDAAQAFVKRLSIPWVNVWDTRKEGAAKIIQRYGISAIPTQILLDRELKVVSLETGGPLLEKSLMKMLTPASPSTESSESKAAENKATDNTSDK